MANPLIVNHCGGVDEAREYMSRHTIDELLEEFGSKPATVYSWETRLGVKALRRCRNCEGIFKHHEMWLSSRGTVQDGLCKKPECKAARTRLHRTGHRAREFSEFDAVAIQLEYLRKPIGPPSGPLFYRGIQGGVIHGE